MIEWWNSLQTIQQICLCFAIPASLVLIIQTILMLIGIGGDGGDFDGDIDGDLDVDADADLPIFSIRGFVSMFCIMGWSCFVLSGTSLPQWATILISILLGILTLIGMALLFRAINRLQSSGNLDLSNAIGKVGQVYIPIPPKAASSGKVNITIQEKYTEFSAITLDEAPLETGTYVRVVSVDEAGTLLVERLSKEEGTSK